MTITTDAIGHYIQELINDHYEEQAFANNPVYDDGEDNVITDIECIPKDGSKSNLIVTADGQEFLILVIAKG